MISLSAPIEDSISVRRYAESEIPTEYGPLRVIVYQEYPRGTEHVALVKGDIEGSQDLPIRVHSECLTGEVFHSLKCDCREQLDLALQRISSMERGAVFYLRQEGRGIGLGNKIRAYALQAQGADTVDANRMLGFEDDLRRYDMVASMLRDLGVQSVALMTNNPLKVRALRQDGVIVTRRIEHQVSANAHNAEYLDTKRTRMGHLYAPVKLRSHEGGEAGSPSDLPPTATLRPLK